MPARSITTDPTAILTAMQSVPAPAEFVLTSGPAPDFQQAVPVPVAQAAAPTTWVVKVLSATAEAPAPAAAGDAAARDTIARAAACRCALAPLRAVHTPRILRARSSRHTG